MDNEQFLIEVEKGHLRSKSVLSRKQKEYSAEGGNRLDQFYRAGAAQNITATEALMGMAIKHVTSIADMAKYPMEYSLKQWSKKIVDLRNYTHLLDALLRDYAEEE